MSIVTRPTQQTRSKDVIGQLLWPSDEALSEGFFFANFALIEGQPQSAEFWKSSIPHPALSSTLKAVGLAGLARHEHSPSLMTRAQKQYLNAVTQTNAALSLPETAKEDNTLVTTMLLGQFEVIAGNDEASMTAWKNHIQGSAALLKLRGIEQIQSPWKARLFTQVVSSLNTACLRYGLPMPEEVTVLRRQMSQYVGHRSGFLTHWNCSLDYVDFNVRIRQGLMENPAEILMKAREIEDRYIAFESTLSDEKRYQTFESRMSHPLIFSDTYHMYPDFFVAQMWNSIRSTRTMLAWTIYDALQELETGELSIGQKASIEEAKTQAAETAKTMLLGILASVPQHIGCNSDGPSIQKHQESGKPGYNFLWSNFKQSIWRFEPTPNASVDVGPQPLLRIFGGYLLPWVVYLVGKSDFSTPEMRAYVLKVLQHLGSDFGIGQAYALMEDVKTGRFSY